MRILQISSCLCVLATLSWGFVTDSNTFGHPRPKKKIQLESVCFKVSSSPSTILLAANRKASVLIQTNSSFVFDKIQQSDDHDGETQFDINKVSASTTDLSSIDSKRRKSAIGVQAKNSAHVGSPKSATRATARSSRAASSSISLTTQDQVLLATPKRRTVSANNRMKPVLEKPRETPKENKHSRLLWETRFEQLLQYKEHHGHCLVPSQYSENPQLGLWVKSQRAAYKRDIMSQNRIQRLAGIGFVWDVVQAHWDLMFGQLVQYSEQYGDCLVPTCFQENPQLARWVKSQRQIYRMKPRTMPEGHIQRLDDIGFVWEPHQSSWEFFFNQLVAYKYQHGNCNVPQQFQENPTLGNWVYNQRQSYQSEPKAMSADRIETLNDIGFVWDPHQVQWETRFAELAKYKQEHGDCLVPQSYEKNPQLGVWVNHQRSNYNKKSNSISEERIQRLNEVGFEWEPHRALWESRFKELLEYKRQHGNCLVPFIYPDNPQLGLWVQTQRSLYKQVPKNISDACIRRLEDIGFVWNFKEGRELRLR